MVMPLEVPGRIKSRQGEVLRWFFPLCRIMLKLFPHFQDDGPGGDSEIATPFLPASPGNDQPTVATRSHPRWRCQTNPIVPEKKTAI